MVQTELCFINTAFAPAIVPVAGQIHSEVLRLLWVLADKQTRNWYALIGAEEEIGSEVFTRNPAHTFSLKMNSIGEVIAYAIVTRLHLSVRSTAPPSRHQPGQPISSAECLMHMHRTAPPLTMHPLAPLSTWMLVHPVLRHLLMLIVQVPLER